MIQDLVLDVEGLRDRAGHDDEFVCELLTDFLAIADSLVDAASQAVGSGQFLIASRDAHRLRGALLALGATRAAATVSELESFATRARETVASDRVALTERVTHVREDVATVCVAMREFIDRHDIVRF